VRRIACVPVLLLVLFPIYAEDKPASQPEPKPKEAVLSYSEGYKAALAQGKPLIVWVGQRGKPHTLDGFIVCSVSEFPDFEGTGCVVSRPGYGRMLRIRDLHGNPSDEDIQAACRGAVAAPSRSVPAVRGNAPARISRSC
jgi:hypothetical protein